MLKHDLGLLSSLQIQTTPPETTDFHGFFIWPDILPTESTTTSPDDDPPPIGESPPANQGKRINLLGQVSFFILFCLAAALFGPLRKSLPTEGLQSAILYADVGIILGMLGWASIWFVFLRVPYAWRVIGLLLAIAVFSGALLGGIMQAGGAGPVSVNEALSGTPGIPMLFLAVQMPLWIQCLFHRLTWVGEDSRSAKRKIRLIPNLLLSLVLVVLTLFCAAIARFPGVNSVINWGWVVAIFAVGSLLTSSIAVFVSLKIRRSWLAFVILGCHVVGVMFLLFFASAMRWIRPRDLDGLVVLFGACLLALYAPFLIARYCGYRLKKVSGSSSS